MQLTTVILIGCVIAVACAAKSGRNGNKPAWSEHLDGWHKVFGLAAFLLTFLIMLNPEFLALGLLGDAAFFDMLVLALSLQLRSIVFQTWHCFRAAVTKASSFVIRGVRRDFCTLVLTLEPLGRAALGIGRVVTKFLRQNEHMLV